MQQGNWWWSRVSLRVKSSAADFCKSAAVIYAACFSVRKRGTAFIDIESSAPL